MSRWSNYGKLDSQFVSEGDGSFTGVNMKLDRGGVDIATGTPLLGPGILARSENKRLAKGSADTRNGTDQPDFANAPPYGATFVGSGLYSNPNGAEVLLIAEYLSNFVWMLQDGASPMRINLPAGEILDTLIRFVQSFDKLELLRGPSRRNLVWDGIDPTGFKLVTKKDPSDMSTLLIPNTWNGEAFQDRILFMLPTPPSAPLTPFFSSSLFAMSDSLDYTSYDPILGVWRINSGGGEGIVRILRHQISSVMVLMNRSIHILQDFTDPLHPENASQEQITGEYNCVAERVPIQIGSDVIVLSQPHGFVKITEQYGQRFQADPVPVSDPIQPLIDRINWPYAWTSLGISLGIYAYFAIPIDGAIRPNAIVVYNIVTSQWESCPDSWADPNFAIDDLRVTFYQGVRRILAIDYVARTVYVLDEGLTDNLASGQYPISDVIETRGYGSQSGSGPASFKAFKRCVAGIRTYNPSVTITAISDGPYEEKVITPTPITKDLTKYYNFAKPDFVPLTDDPTQPKRQDYSAVLGTFVGQDFDALPDGPITTLPFVSSDVAQGPKQESLERKPLRQSGRWVSIRIANTQGQCDVLAVGVDAIETERVTRVAA